MCFFRPLCLYMIHAHVRVRVDASIFHAKRRFKKRTEHEFPCSVLFLCHVHELFHHHGMVYVLHVVIVFESLYQFLEFSLFFRIEFLEFYGRYPFESS